MSQQMRPQSFTKLLNWIVREYREYGSIFGIHKSLFYTKDADAPYRSHLYGQLLDTPIGPAAGPNTQLTQNIVASWLSGARYIELKTVQIMDELELAHPCIDMEDEGYNVEWSQELKLEESVHEYIKAWVLIPVLQRLLRVKEVEDDTIFNLSVGYNLQGILEPGMQKFIGTMTDAAAEIAGYRSQIARLYPEFADVKIKNSLTNSCTLSTMHGCPPDEIGRIAHYLLEERGLHLCVKLNPTLMGADFVRDTLNRRLGYDGIAIPDSAFDHDLKYPQALEIIRDLQETAEREQKFFGVKLSNTLAVKNLRGVMSGDEMYMSGRSLHPITINLWNRLYGDLGDGLNVSYSAGADALNVAELFACGALTVTSASDILKPGGYSRLLQYLENLKEAMLAAGADSLPEFADDRARNLQKAADAALENPRYQKRYFSGSPKVDNELPPFDCITAPCTAQCAVCQDVPSYILAISRGDYDGALRSILGKNPLPGLTGHVCTHLCESRCTRADYDRPVNIRALKRFAAVVGTAALSASERKDVKVAVIGAGPSGLAAAAHLAQVGADVTIFDSRSRTGGMMAIAPTFRLPQEVMDKDVERIAALGVRLELGKRIETRPEDLLGDYDAVYVATGFPLDMHLGIEGEEASGVWTALNLLERVADGEKPDLGQKILVVGGGNTAVDAARTAQRLTGKPATMVYRRTIVEMPAIAEEKELLFEEGNRIIELVLPLRVVVKDDRVVGLECERTTLGEDDESGRRRPVPTGEIFTIEADSIIAAIGQRSDKSAFKDTGMIFTEKGAIAVDPRGHTSARGVYAGGDAATGPAIVIAACADGRRAAETIGQNLGLRPNPPGNSVPRTPDLQVKRLKENLFFQASPEKIKMSFQSFDLQSGVWGPSPQRGLGRSPKVLPLCLEEDGIPLAADEYTRIMVARTRKVTRNDEERLTLERRSSFDLVERTFDERAAIEEAERCLQCSTVCGKCVEVCPNRANYAYRTLPVALMLPTLSVVDGSLEATGSERFEIRQSSQIVHIDDLCNECGNCATFCVHEGRPYRDKPRICLNDEVFATESDNIYRLTNKGIKSRVDGQTETLEIRGKGWLYENDDFSVVLDKFYRILGMSLKNAAFSGSATLARAAEMSIIHGGIANNLPWLLQ